MYKALRIAFHTRYYSICTKPILSNDPTVRPKLRLAAIIDEAISFSCRMTDLKLIFLIKIKDTFFYND